VIGIITEGRQIGGAEILCLDLAEWLYESGEKVWLYIGTGGKDQITQRAKQSGVRMIEVKDLTSNCEASESVFLYGTKLIGQQENLAARVNRARKIFAFVGGFGEDYVDTRYLRVDSFWCEVDAIRKFFVSRGISEQMFVRSRIPTIVEAVDRERIFGELFTFIVIARLFPRKCVDQAISAFKMLEGDYVLLIIGDGSERRKLEIFADDDYRIVFLGLIEDRLTMQTLLSCSDCFLSPSEWEGCSRIVREAMGLGVPVIATEGFYRHGNEMWGDGTPEIVFHGQTGLLRPANDVQRLTELMDSMVRDERLRMRLSRDALDFIKSDNVVSGMKCLDLLRS